MTAKKRAMSRPVDGLVRRGDAAMITTMLDVPTFLQSWFYQNCKRQRKAGAKICGECPFREGIEQLESNVPHHLSLPAVTSPAEQALGPAVRDR